MYFTLLLSVNGLLLSHLISIYLLLIIPFYCSVVSVELKVPAPVTEGADLTVCATLTFIDDTTILECDVTVSLETTDGTKAGVQ